MQFSKQGVPELNKTLMKTAHCDTSNGRITVLKKFCRQAASGEFHFKAYIIMII